MLVAATWHEASKKARKRSWKAAARFLSVIVVIALGMTVGAGVCVEPSDDMAAQAGDTTGTFDEKARGRAILVRILRPQDGDFQEPEVSADGFPPRLQPFEKILERAVHIEGDRE
ncbi:hypothetical protein [Phytomonospora endophytica]|uniref:Uncharacterized protein n=1 Tax=Phytomonospora endophytica TaxID=714109 RepID=A0A841FMZ3_9ACTN|nr:hypothetical protein [Phytomonospora endophytica]MBB6038681.1 hypothetical protein [Phytomonospora endophytica]